MEARSSTAWSTRRTGELTNRKGIALVEMMLVIPILAVIIGFIYFIGWGMMNLLEVNAADHYTVWHNVYAGAVATERVNEGFMDNRAANIVVEYGNGFDTTLRDFVAAAGNVGPGAQGLAENTILGKRFPLATTVTLSSTFPTSVSLWQAVLDRHGPLVAADGREGPEWRRLEASESSTIVNLYLTDIETTMSEVPDPGTDMATAIRNVYSSRSGW